MQTASLAGTAFRFPFLGQNSAHKSSCVATPGAERQWSTFLSNQTGSSSWQNMAVEHIPLKPDRLFQSAEHACRGICAVLSNRALSSAQPSANLAQFSLRLYANQFKPPLQSLPPCARPFLFLYPVASSFGSTCTKIPKGSGYSDRFLMQALACEFWRLATANMPDRTARRCWTSECNAHMAPGI
eukprot:1136240-Pelagomonas_calceolata.AAC.15